MIFCVHRNFALKGWRCNNLVPTAREQKVYYSFFKMFRQKTKAVWAKHFPEEPFDLDESKGNSPQEFPNGLVSKIGYNIEEAALRQRDFYYQVRMGFNV